MKVKVEITEILKRVVEIETTSVDRAVTIITTDYADGYISLEKCNRVGFSIKQYTGEGEE